ncbi:MAG: DNA polymerase III subunit delta' [Rhodospirillaceae bacterium]|nr:DNA polymerase III subunit delta' [Rhodospirillaceae bacterium]
MTERQTPRETYGLVGQEAAEAAFLSAWQSGRMPHAWLLTGPEGIGKATLAFRIARFVLSGGGAIEDSGPSLFGDEPTAASEGLSIDAETPTAKQIEAGAHADLRTMEAGWVNPKTGRASQQIVVDQVRAALEVTNLTASGWRVVIIDPADAMNVNAANAVLKNLEEPPPKTLFLLVSHAPGRLLPTIRSRCSQLDLKPLATDQIVAHLRSLGGLEEGNLEAVAKLSRGSIGKALQLVEGNGFALYEALHRAASGLPNLDMMSVHALGDLVSRRKADTEDGFPILVNLIVDWLAALVLSGTKGEVAPEILTGEHALRARLLAEGAPLDRWVEVWEKVGALLNGAERVNLDRKQVLIQCFSLIAAAAAPAR